MPSPVRRRPTGRGLAIGPRPGHGLPANVLNPRFRELGAGVANGAPFGDNIEPAATYDHEFGVTR